MAEIDLLDSIPKPKRDLDSRAASAPEDRAVAKQFGREYFDGTRNQGYGGYRYDGRWKPVVKRFIEHYKLTSESRILDVGCAKGFLMHDFHEALPKATLAGIDVSQYALDNAMPDVRPFMKIGNAKKLDFPDKSFDLIIAINTIHNLNREDLKTCLREFERVSSKYKYLVVDAYHNEEERAKLLKWNLTAQTHMYCDEWVKLFKEVGYTGDYYWFIP